MDLGILNGYKQYFAIKKPQRFCRGYKFSYLNIEYITPAEKFYLLINDAIIAAISARPRFLTIPKARWAWL